MQNIKIAVLTISDRCSAGLRADKSGPAIVDYLKNCSFTNVITKIIPDDRFQISDWLKALCDKDKCDIVITTGGTGLAPTDVTPEATMEIADRIVPGIAEAIRAFSLTKTKNAMLSRGIAVQRGTTLIVNLPGNPKACIESMDVIIEALPHAVGIMKGEKLDS